MIDEIHVQNLALIADASIEPAPGLTALTGETGAGKTALLTSCKLLMGARADRNSVREGEDEARVDARFFFGEDECVVTRRISSDGRSRVNIDGQMASVGELASVIAPTIDLCSQHDNQTLLQSEMQMRLLDAWAKNEDVLQEYKDAFEEFQMRKHELADLREGAAATAEQVEAAKFTLRQIDAVSPDKAEYEELRVSLKRSENAEAIARAAHAAKDALSGEGGALEQSASAANALDEGAKYDDRLQGMSESLHEAIYLLEDASRDISVYTEEIEFDPATLEQMHERMAAYQSILRAYGPEVEDVLASADEARARLEMVDNSEQLELQVQRRLEEATDLLEDKAKALSSSRIQAAGTFASAITEVMGSLEMGSAALVCDVSLLPQEQWTLGGPNRIELMFRPAKNMQERPLSRIASGGELSRVLLALHVVMEKNDQTETLVFDEIDAGVGGATAIALADTLARLAETHQVLVVTHLPQVAARAQKHYVVRKRETDGLAETELSVVNDEARVEEIARMLSGANTETSLAHARELLENH